MAGVMLQQRHVFEQVHAIPSPHAAPFTHLQGALLTRGHMSQQLLGLQPFLPPFVAAAPDRTTDSAAAQDQHAALGYALLGLQQQRFLAATKPVV